MRLFIAVLSLVPLLATAETAYVTDNLRLNMYQNADLSGTRVDTLVSGQEFEVLSRNAQTALVELQDGRQGYVSAAYMVTEKPARLIVTETQAANDRLTQELADMRASFAEPAALVDRLRQESADLQAIIDANSARMAELENENEAHVSRASRYQYSLPYTWVAGAILICLLGGFLLGLWWVDRQSRKRHGGIRVY
jgi:SH3 domain protein